ncbi:hypothetical protein E4U44_000508, partial [Claviceps purpurea]
QTCVSIDCASQVPIEDGDSNRGVVIFKFNQSEAALGKYSEREYFQPIAFVFRRFSSFRDIANLRPSHPAGI